MGMFSEQAEAMADQAHNDALDEAAKVLEVLSDSQTMQLHAGEMTAQELRTAKAVLMLAKTMILRLKTEGN